MSTEQMRAEVSSAYSGNSWKEKVKKMSDAQVIAIYKKFLSEGKI